MPFYGTYAWSHRNPKNQCQLTYIRSDNGNIFAKGTSLLEESSYPTGGKNTHAVLSGHRGLPEAKLFTDLPKLKKGDQFFIQINGKTLAYQVEKSKWSYLMK